MAEGLTQEEILALPDGSIVELRDHLSRTYAAAQRIGLNQSVGRNPEPGERRGWVLTEYVEYSSEFAIRICDESFGSHRIIELNGGERVLFDYRDYPDYLSSDYREAGDRFIEELEGLAEYSMISVRGAEILGLKLDDETWATSDYSWMDDAEALETEFSRAGSIWKLSDGKSTDSYSTDN